MNAILALPPAGRRWYALVMLVMLVALVTSLSLSPLQLHWWQVVVLGLIAGVVTIVTDPHLVKRHSRERITTSHGVVIGYVVLSIAGPTSSLLVYAIQYGLVQVLQALAGRAVPAHKWWFNQATVVVSAVGAWLLIAPWRLPIELTTLLIPLLANLINAGLVLVMVASARGQPVLDDLRASWRQLLWANIDSALVAHYASLVWLHLPWLIVTMPLLTITRGQLAQIVSQMVDRAAIEAELARQDGLTGLPNRRSLDQQLKELPGSQAVAAFLMIDLDRFKLINDSAGHLAGDDVLRAVARCLQGQVRPGDTIGRYGGEELCVIAPGLGGRAEAEQLGERLRAAVASLEIDTVTASGAALQVRVTVSIGISLWQAGGEPAQVLQAADKALYEAKHAGRDRVQFLAVGPLDAAA